MKADKASAEDSCEGLLLLQGEVAEGNASEIPWDPEHVNIGNECDKILLHSAEVNGVAGILKVQ